MIHLYQRLLHLNNRSISTMNVYQRSVYMSHRARWKLRPSVNFCPVSGNVGLKSSLARGHDSAWPTEHPIACL
jgi:hypothetical protein